MRDLEYGIVAKDKSAPGFDSAEARAKRFNGVLDKTQSAYALAGTAAKAFAAAFTLTAVSGFGRMVKDVIGDAADLVDLADKVGVSTGDVQRLQYGFKLAGIEAEEVDGILTQWSKRIGEAYTHGGKLADVLKANGISLTDSEGHLRSSVDLMGDYADLIERAGSDQERMTLAVMGFGKAGDGMVLALRDGKLGLEKLMGAADDAGGVLDEEILRKAAEIDDAFDKMWRTFEIRGKSAVLSVVGAMDEAISNAEKVAANRQNAWANAATIFADTNTTKGGRLPLAGVQDRFGTTPEEMTHTDAQVKFWQDYYASKRKTVIPDDTPTRTASTSAAKDQVSAYQQVIDKLQEEQGALGLNATQQRIVSEQRRAGVTATSAEGQAIAALITEIDREKAAKEALAEQTEFLKTTTASFMTTFRHDMEAGEGVMASFSDAFAGMVDSIATKIEERLAGGLVDALMGTTGGQGFGLLGMLFGSTGAFVPNTTLGGFLGVTSAPKAAGGSMIGTQAAKAGGVSVRIEQKVPAKVHVQEEDDEAGGKRLAIILDEENAAAIARPGSRSSRAMRQRFGIKQRLTKR